MSETQNQEQQATQPQAQPELSITDLQNIKSLIDVSARRGAYSAGEMEAVGAVYNKLAKFLEAVTASAQEPKA